MQTIHATDSIQDAINQASAGDTVQIDSTCPDGQQVRLSKPVNLICEETDAPRLANLWIRNTEHIRISGLQFQDNANTHAVTVDKCTDIIVDNCRFRNCGVGVVVTGSTQVNIHSCTIRDNTGDGIVVANGSSNVELRRNTITGSWGRNRPGHHADAIQLFGDVWNVRILENVCIGNMQAIMVQGAIDLLIEGNQLAGCSGPCVNIGHSSCHQVTIQNNIIGFSALTAVNLTGTDISLIGNTFLMANGKPAWGYVAHIGPVVSECRENRYITTSENAKPKALAMAGGEWAGSLQELQTLGMDGHSAIGHRPDKWQRIPFICVGIHPRKVWEPRKDGQLVALPLWEGAELLQPGCFCQFNATGDCVELVDVDVEHQQLVFRADDVPDFSNPPIVCAWRWLDFSGDWDLAEVLKHPPEITEPKPAPEPEPEPQPTEQIRQELEQAAAAIQRALAAL